MAAILVATACTNGDGEQNPSPAPTPPVVVEPEPTPIPGGTTWWKPGPIKKFQIVHIKSFADLKKKFRKGVEVIELELDQLEEAGGQEVADWIHDQGAKLIAYTSSGYEEWRDDADKFPKNAIGGKICKSDSCITWWKGEKWGKPLVPEFFEFHATRAARALAAGADAIEFDNQDWYANKVGYTITKQQNIEAIKKLSDVAHAHDLAFFAKNAGGISKEISPYAQGVLIEECAEYSECSDYKAYLGKPIMMLEYSTSCKPFEGAACNKTGDYFE